MTQRDWFEIGARVAVENGGAGVDVRFGSGRVAEIGDFLLRSGVESVMLVTSPNVGSNAAVIGPVRQSLAGLEVREYFDVSRGKHVSSLYKGIEAMAESDVQAIVGIGGGGSLDTARQMSAFAADGRPMSDVQDSVRAEQNLSLNVVDPIDVVLVPTTLAGADLSSGGSIEVLSPDESPDGLPKRINPRNVAPRAVFYDPELYRSTPVERLAGSAMNGLNKGIETIYSASGTPYSDAVSTHGVTLMARGLVGLAGGAGSLPDVVAGLILVQLQRRISVLHAFGHAVARHTPIQQGVAHAVVTPHVLRMLLSVSEIRRDLLARSLRAAGLADGVDDEADAILHAVTRVRDDLGLPASFTALGYADDLDIEVLARHVCSDSLMEASPLGRPLTVSEARGVFEAAL